MPTVQDIPAKQELVQEAVEKLRYFTKLYGIDSLFIVGGYCRSAYLGELWKVKDIDVASAFHEQSLQLAGLFGSEVLNTTPEVYHRSGAAALDYESEFGTIRIEFQGNSTNAYMYNEDVRLWMRNNGIPDVPLMNNIYGRDFTINSMIYSLSEDTLLDPIGQAAEGFHRKIIRSILPAEMLIRYNPLAMLRAIRFAMTYDFHIDAPLRLAMRGQVAQLRKSLSEDRILREIVGILRINGPEGLKMLKKFELDGLLMHPEIKEYLSLESKDD